MNILLILGCWGRTDENGFCSCKAIENVILDFSAKTFRNKEILDYLDTFYKLFDKPLYSNVHTALYNIQEKFGDKADVVFEINIYKKMEEFCILHSKCGLYLKLGFKEELGDVCH